MANGISDYNFNPRMPSLRSRPSGAITVQGSLPVGYNIPSNLGLLTMPGGGMENLRMPMPGTLNPSNLPDVGLQAAQAQPSSPQQPSGLRSRMQGILGSIGGFLSNPNVLDTLAIGFGGMSMNPNQALMQQAANRIEQRQYLEMAQSTKNRTIQTLRDLGMNREADILENADPSMVATLAAEYLSPDYQATGGRKPVGIPRVDPVNGQVYIVTQTGERQDIEGAFSETPSQQFERVSAEGQINQARDKGVDVFNTIQELDKQSSIYSQMLSELDAGAQTGFIRNFFPAMNAETAQIRSLANQLGLGVVASVTFGALSASELNLALSTAIDTNAPPEVVRDQIVKKQAAQRKLREFLSEQAQTLTSGIRYDQYITDYLRRTAEAEEQGLLDEVQNLNTNLLPGVSGVRVLP
jgi:hypothetical protein